jgi:hypothetical protein
MHQSEGIGEKMLKKLKSHMLAILCILTLTTLSLPTQALATDVDETGFFPAETIPQAEETSTLEPTSYITSPINLV